KCGGGGVFAGVGGACGDFPAPPVGDEAVPVQQQDATVGVGGEDADRGGGDADDVVGDAAAVGQGDVGQGGPERGAVVGGAAVAGVPLHVPITRGGGW